MVRKIREHRAKSRCPREDIMNFFPDSQASAEVLSAAKFVERENTIRSNSGSKSSFLNDVIPYALNSIKICYN